MDIRFSSALAAVKMVGASGILDLTEDDLSFVTGSTPWISTDRSRARRCVEAVCYGTVDVVGLPRVSLPAEFIAGAIATYVHPVNIQSACAIMEGAEFSENVINGVERPLKASELFSFTLRFMAGATHEIDSAQKLLEQAVTSGA
ncbi:MAG: hypothetical protein [Microviridae sp.]|nr:MAG: hypothetical protein [Microviridae sp.]